LARRYTVSAEKERPEAVGSGRRNQSFACGKLPEEATQSERDFLFEGN
jgi:hypothetical protein